MAMPAIGTGKLAFPLETVATIICDEVHKFSKNNKKTTLTDIRIVVLQSETAMIQVCMTIQTLKISRPCAN
jgi:O-acetyl-ADP-ribose deacetylase (regulator of RNase III)